MYLSYQHLYVYVLTGALHNSQEETMTSSHAAYSLRLMLAILLGIVIGVLTGLVLLTVVYYCYRK